MLLPTERFSDRVENYVKYRPGYPPEVLRILAEETGWSPESTVVDVGSGTGLLAEVFLKAGNTVYGVEPNREMRMAGERLLAGYPAFHSVEGTAEATTLPPVVADLIAAGQAFHWFQPGPAREEFVRVLKPGGAVALIWNDRWSKDSPFQDDYEALLRRHGTDYTQVNHNRISQADIAAFFVPGKVVCRSCPNYQDFDGEGLRGRLLSCSYVPRETDPGFDPMMEELEGLFHRHQKQGRVRMEYDTKVYVGRLTEGHTR